jgi:hypothetical protein
MLQSDKRGSFRSFLLIVVGIFLGATLITPAVAHVGGSVTHLFGHLKPKIRSYGNTLWLGKTAKAADSLHADSADHATTADSADSATTAASATVADDADLLDGRDAADFDDAQTLDGIDSPSFFAVGRSGSTALCDPQSATMVTCASASITLPRAARVFVIAESDWNTFGTTAPTQGFCEIRVDGTSQAGTAIRAGETTKNTDTTGHYQHTGSTFVSGSLAAGAHTFAFVCNEEDNDIEYRNVMVSAIMLGAA